MADLEILGPPEVHAYNEDMFVSGGGSAADVDTSSDSEEEEPPQRPQRNRQAPRRADV